MNSLSRAQMMYALREGERLRREGVLPPMKPPLTLEDAFDEKDFREGRFEVIRDGKVTPEAVQWVEEIRNKYCPQIAGLDKNGNFFMDCINTMPWYWYNDTMGGQR